MHLNKKVSCLLATVALLTPAISNAVLVDRGGGLLYDTVLDVTWLQDANYARTSGYDDYKGYMTWDQAKTWADTLVYYDSVRNVTYSDWRLASNSPVDGISWDYWYSYKGESDVGYNISAPASELAYMFYVNLGLKGIYDINGQVSAEYGLFSSPQGSADMTKDIGLVRNLANYTFWSETPFNLFPGYPKAFSFSFQNGYQGGSNISYLDEHLAWAVRPGDVAAVAIPDPEPNPEEPPSEGNPVPEPGIIALLGIGMMGLRLLSRFKKP